jgi:hypothetical protein
MKALSIKQPWVWAILNVGKDVENRTWTSNHRGWLALHASGKPMPATDDDFPGRIRCPDLKSLHYSAICGVARVVDIRPTSRSKWFWRPGDGRVNYGWVLEDVTPLPEPIACKGTLGLWTVPPKVRRAIQRQLPKLDFGDA